MPVDIVCPQCNRFLAEVDSYGRAVCSRCGWEVTIRDKAHRELSGSYQNVLTLGQRPGVTTK